MAVVRLQGDLEKSKGIYYQFDDSSQPIGHYWDSIVYEGICLDNHTDYASPVAILCIADNISQSVWRRMSQQIGFISRHDNLVNLLGFFEIETGSSSQEMKQYVVSELFDGVLLSDVFEGKTRNRKGEEIPYVVKMLQDHKNNPEHFAETIVTQVLTGLMALHDAGISPYLDVEPSSILLATDGHVKLIGFHIAKYMIYKKGFPVEGIQFTGGYIGLPEYDAPERFNGNVSSWTPATDIYNVGILLFHCILWHPPYEGSMAEILLKQVHSKIPLDKIKNKKMRGVIAKACMKNPKKRYQSAEEMREDIVNFEATRNNLTVLLTCKKWMMVALVVLAFLTGVLVLVKYL